MSGAYISGKFICGGTVLDSSPSWGMSVRSAGNMKFSWSIPNRNRDCFLSALCGPGREIAQVEPVHSKTVYCVSSASELFQKKGDGIISENRRLIPVVTAADCMPVFLYDRKSKSFGVLHSGWKGTGIAAEAVRIISERHGSQPGDFCIVLGPHINSCCYHVDRERADYFRRNFGDSCVAYENGTYSLSLAEANCSLLRRLGIPAGNILVSNECTCCCKENGAFKYSSFRRLAASLPQNISAEEKRKPLAVQAAFVCAEGFAS